MCVCVGKLSQMANIAETACGHAPGRKRCGFLIPPGVNCRAAFVARDFRGAAGTEDASVGSDQRRLQKVVGISSEADVIVSKGDEPIPPVDIRAVCFVRAIKAVTGHSSKLAQLISAVWTRGGSIRPGSPSGGPIGYKKRIDKFTDKRPGDRVLYL